MHVPHHPDHRGEGKDLKDLSQVVTVIEGRQPPTLQAEGGGLTVLQKRMLTVLGESTPTTPQGGQGDKCPAHDLRIVVAFDAADPQNANHQKDRAFSPLPRPQGRGERSE